MISFFLVCVCVCVRVHFHIPILPTRAQNVVRRRLKIDKLAIFREGIYHRFLLRSATFFPIRFILLVDLAFFPMASALSASRDEQKKFASHFPIFFFTRRDGTYYNEQHSFSPSLDPSFPRCHFNILHTNTHKSLAHSRARTILLSLKVVCFTRLLRVPSVYRETVIGTYSTAHSTKHTAQHNIQRAHSIVQC